jgi:zinc finger protein
MESTKIETDSSEHDHKTQQMFSDLNPENSFTEVPSLCMNCEEQGVTRLLMTKIPFFRVIYIS